MSQRGSLVDYWSGVCVLGCDLNKVINPIQTQYTLVERQPPQYM